MVSFSHVTTEGVERHGSAYGRLAGRRDGTFGEHSRTPAALDGVCFGRVVDTWAEHGAAVPVAVVVSVVDDLLEAAPAAARSVIGEPTLDDVMVDARGIARLAVALRDPVEDVSRLMLAALAGGGEEAVPAAAVPVLKQALSRDPFVRPSDAEALRLQVRAALGAPATREEVAELVGYARPEPLAVPSLVPAHAEDVDLLSAVEAAPPPAITEDLPELPPEELADVSAEPVTEVVESAPPMPAPAPVEKLIAARVLSPLPERAPTPLPARAPTPLPARAQTPAPSVGQSARPVLRHAPNRDRPVSLPTAPAARLPIPGEGESPVLGGIQLPNEGRARAIGAAIFAIVLAVIAALYFLNP